VRVGDGKGGNPEVEQREPEPDEAREDEPERLDGEREGEQRRGHGRRCLQAADGTFVAVVVRVVGGDAAIQEHVKGDEPE
jgi:hypothetical protein